MLIPSIDLMDGKIVQLIQGEKKALEFADFTFWVEHFSRFPVVQLIDLDAAFGRGENRRLVETLCRQLPCQVGGGVRSLEIAQQLLAAGARRVIVGSSLFSKDGVQTDFAERLASAISAKHLVFAVDSRKGKVVTKGWTTSVPVTSTEAVRLLQPWCHSFLYTHVETEGLLQGFPLDRVCELRQATTRHLIVAGGITSQAEVDTLERMGADAVVGMALYTGRIALERTASTPNH